MKPPAGSAIPETPASRSDAALPPSPARAPNPLAAALGGNRCGHVPSAPRFALTLPPQANPARPALIAKAVSKLREYYRTPREGRWDALSQAERQARLNRPRPAAGGSDPEDGKRARWRQQRSERREALVAVIGLLLYYTDIRTLTVAVPRGGDWLGLSGPWIAGHTGLSASRVKRALATLARSAWLVNTGRGRQFDRRRRCWVGAGWGPVRRLSFRLIRALGLDVSWRQAQRKARRPDARAPVPAAGSQDGSQTAPPPTEIPGLARPAPAPGAARETQRERARALRQALASPAARRAEADPAGHHASIERQRRLAEWAAEGLSLAEARQRLNDTPQPP